MGQDGRREAEETGQRDTARMTASPLAGRYELLEQVGAGASALTWRARDARLGRIVAVKLLRPALAADPGYAQRFEREAQLAASISHPNVVDIYDVGQEDGQLYIVMQFVDGEDLKHLIAREGRLRPDRAVAIAQQILDGLGAIHRAGIIHRDIKPQNVLIGGDGIARVTDFGVAHIEAGEGLTSTGTAIGTAAYMAPEQAEGGTIGEATDIYAAGVVLYEMLTGRLPFSGPSPMAIMLAHIQHPVTPPSQAAPGAGITPALDGVILQAMAKAPQDRFRTARAMNQALAGTECAGSPSATTQRVDRPHVPQDIRALPTATAYVPPVSRVLAPPAAQARKRRRSFVPALLVAMLLVAAVAAAGYVFANGLPGGGGSGKGNLPAIVDATATQVVTVGPTSPADTAQPPTQTAPTETQAVIVPLDPTQTPEMPTATPTDTPVATETPSPTPTPTPIETPVPTTEPTQPLIEPSTNRNTGGNLIVPVRGSTSAAEPTRPAPRVVRAEIASSDWQGVPVSSQGGEQAALLSGGGSGSSAATLRFQLSGAGGVDELTLILHGAATSAGGGVPIIVNLNGVTVIQESSPFPATAGSQLSFSDAVFHIPAANLVDGENTLEIVNAGTSADSGTPPVIALSTGTLAIRVTGADGTIQIESPPAQTARDVKVKPTKQPKSKNGNDQGNNGNGGNGQKKHGN